MRLRKGMPSRHRHDTRLKPVARINMTPLMDLTFLLLIVFMITAPMLEYVLDVSPPRMEAETKPDSPQTVVLTLTKSGKVRFRDTAVPLSELEQAMRTLKKSVATPRVLIRADHRRKYGEVLKVMREVRDAGILNVSLITRPERPG